MYVVVVVVVVVVLVVAKEVVLCSYRYHQAMTMDAGLVQAVVLDTE